MHKTQGVTAIMRTMVHFFELSISPRSSDAFLVVLLGTRYMRVHCVRILKVSKRHGFSKLPLVKGLISRVATVKGAVCPPSVGYRMAFGVVSNFNMPFTDV